MIASIVLAAGGARRFGSQKLLADAGGVRVIERVVDVARAESDVTYVVIGSEAHELLRVLASRGVSIVRNLAWAEGLSTSLAAGVAALPPEVEAALVLL